MSNLMMSINSLIEDEIEARVNQRLSGLLEHISKKWDISLVQLLKDISTGIPDTKMTQCLGSHKKSQKRCKNKPQPNGFCHMHQSQVPKKYESPKMQQHTHSLPPFYLKGCPVCDKSHKFKDNIDLDFFV